MKNKFTCIFACLLIGAVGCSKVKVSADDVAGTWEWIRTDGGIAFHIHETPANTGKNINLTINADNSYVLYTNDSLTYEGSYTLLTQQCIHDHSDKTVLNFSAPYSASFMIERLSGDSLELSDELYDGTGSLYRRKNF